MSWRIYHLEYELLSPLHVGYHKVGNVQRTRYYLPARNLWGAMTERLTRSGFTLEVGIPPGDYQRVGQWLRAHCAFGYLFICRDDQPLYPCYSPRGLRYGDWAEAAFERRYLATHVTTALDPASTSAQAESLHEVEYIAPYDREGRRTCMGGWVWLDEVAHERLAANNWRDWPTELQVGGERRYGFGRLRLRRSPAEDHDLPAGYQFNGDGGRPRLSTEGGKPLLAHTLVDSVSARGMIEPLVGREAEGDSDRFGQRVTAACLTWMPGSITSTDTQLIVDSWGTWRAAS